MELFVTTFILEDGVNDDLTGPFPDEASALSWIDSQIDSVRNSYPEYSLERSDDNEFTMFSDEADDPRGFVYQIIPASTPVEVVNEEA